MTTENKYLPASLVYIHTNLVEKLGAQPALAPSMRVEQSGEWSIMLYKNANYEPIVNIKSDNPKDTVRKALAFIEGMVSKEEQRAVDWQKGLAKVIDDGHDMNLPDNVLAPLRASSQAMTENLLTVAS